MSSRGDEHMTDIQKVQLVEAFCAALNRSLKGEGPLVDDGTEWTPLDDLLTFAVLQGRRP